MPKQRVPYTVEQKFHTGGINECYLTTCDLMIKKPSLAQSPFLLVNEFVAAKIAEFLRLPVLPNDVLAIKGEAACFGTLRLTCEDESPPRDAIPENIFNLDPAVCAGIVLFDILIANPDRHSGNFMVDDPYSPSQIWIIDHERALLGHDPRQWRGITGLNHGLDLGVRAPGGPNHCLIRHLKDLSHIEQWLVWIEDIPDSFISRVCEEMLQYGPPGARVTREMVDTLAGFLIARRDLLAEIITNNYKKFPSMKDLKLVL